MDLPRDVVEVVSEHLSQMSRPGVELLTRAAVLGRRFDLTKLGIVSGLQTRELLAQLDEAVRAQVLRRDPDGSLHFAHRLVRDVLYQRLSSSERSRLHAAVALDLLAHYGKAHERHLKELADHFARALPEGDVERTIELAMRAAEEEARAGRPLQATAYWGSAARALAMIPGGDPRQLEVAVGLAHAWQAAGRDKEAREALVDVKILERAFGKSS
jgi:predicted ATPase